MRVCASVFAFAFACACACAFAFACACAFAFAFACACMHTTVTTTAETSVVGFIGFHQTKTHLESGNYYADFQIVCVFK